MEAEALALMEVEAGILLNHNTKVVMVVPTAAAARVVVGGSTYCQGMKLAGEESQRRDKEATSCNKFVNSAKHRWCHDKEDNLF